MTAVRQTWQVNLRYLRVLGRQPAYLGITLTQPIIWLLLFGALFKAVTEIPGFHGGSYVDFLTPGVVVMLAVSSAGWTGMSFIEDINAGVMDRVLVSPVWRGALNLGSVAYAMITIVIQTALIVLLAAGPRGALHQRRRRRAHPAPRGRAARGGVRLAVERHRDAGAPARDADRGGQPRPAAADVPVLGAHAAEPRARWIRTVSRFNPVNWAVEAGRSAAMQKLDWGLVASRVGLLAALVVVCAAFATRAFATYQRSL